jgi:hypothetical protein
MDEHSRLIVQNVRKGETWTNQETLTEGVGLVQLTSSLRQLVMDKRNKTFSVFKTADLN